MARAAAAVPENPPVTGKVGRGSPPEETRFETGKSGNPGGRPKGLARKARELVGEDGETLLLFWASVMSDPKEKAADRLTASKLLAERGWGKAPSFVPIEDGDPLELAEAHAEEIAAAFDQRIDELAARRKTKKS